MSYKPKRKRPNHIEKKIMDKYVNRKRKHTDIFCFISSQENAN